MLFRLLILVLAVVGAWYLYRTHGQRLLRDPRVRYLLSGVGVQMLVRTLRRQGVPLLLRLMQSLRALRFFR